MIPFLRIGGRLNCAGIFKSFRGGAPLRLGLRVSMLVILALSLLFAQDKPRGDTDVTRATLDNGLRVVIVRDPLAPVVTVEENYLVGGERNSRRISRAWRTRRSTWRFADARTLTADQISAIFAQLGGFGNADTQQNITQYFATVPAADLDIALRVDADCMRDIQDSQTEWAQEKRRHRAGSGARSVQSHLQIHHAPE